MKNVFEFLVNQLKKYFFKHIIELVKTYKIINFTHVIIRIYYAGHMKLIVNNYLGTLDASLWYFIMFTLRI